MQGGVYLLFLLTMFSNVFLVQSEPVELLPNLQQRIEVEVEKEFEKEDPKTFQMSLVGDLLMDGSIKYQIDRYGTDYPWEMVREYFQNDDLTIGNLETSITNRGTEWPEKSYNFRSDPKNLKSMEAAGMDVLALANNHILDYGYDGLLDTIKHIDNTRIKRVGAGKNKEDAMKAVIVEKEGFKIGILSASRVVPHVEWYATGNRPGLIGAYDGHIEELLKEVQELKKDVDLIVLSIHWGIEGSSEPKDQDLLLARKLIDGGVDLIMGHHPHVLQGIEIYKGKPILYSLGNFVFGTQGELTSNTMIAQINIVDGEMNNIEIIPFQIELGRPMPVTEDIRRSKIAYLNKISKRFGVKIGEDGIINLDNY